MTDKSLLDILWMLVAASLVFLMQAGFTCLESGLTRAKNSINVAVKNLTDVTICAVLFWAFGFALMFGESAGGWIGLTGFFAPVDEETGWLGAFFLYEAMFCGTAVTIISGAVAERMRFKAYILVAVVVSSLIYPIFGHWAWGGTLQGTSGWLQGLGFVDFAGSTVVHSIGGWIALALLIIIGPRGGRFGREGLPKEIEGANLSMSVLGVLLLWFGWFGFNGGSLFGMSERVPGILANTFLAGASGAIACLSLGWYVKGQSQVREQINGVLAGLVAITASCHAVSPKMAVLIGAVGGVAMLGVSHLLLRLRVDDAVDAVGVHLGAGIWGTLAVGLFGDLERLATGLTRTEQIGVQLLGSLVCAVFAFCFGSIVLRLINRFYPYRVTPEEEELGLNVSEHGATTALLDMYQAMDEQAAAGDVSMRLHVDPFSEVRGIAMHYNRVMSGLEKTEEELIQAKEEAERSAHEAEASNQAKSAFLTNVSHEIRTPMNAILGFAEILNGRLHDLQDQEYLASIRTSGKALLALINNILDLSKVEAGKADVLLAPVEAHTLIRDVATLFQPRAEEKGLAFHLTIDEAMPEVLILDDALLRQTLTNLIGNAIKFTHQGYVRVRVKPVFVGGDESRLDLVMNVADSGIGIADDQREEIFGAFNQQRGQNVNEYGGTGLGLAITRRIVELMGGDVTLASEVGKGSTFTTTLRNVKVATVEDLSARGVALDADTIQFQSATVLVADDVATNRLLVRGYFADTAVTVLEAEDGSQAMEVARRERPDLILMDMNMLVLDGFKATRMLKADPELGQIPVIALTGTEMKESEAEIRKVSDGYLRKPVSRGELIRELAKYLPHSTERVADKPIDTLESESTWSAESMSEAAVERLRCLADAFDAELHSAWESVRTSANVTAAEGFAERVESLMAGLTYPPLSDWTRALKAQASAFQVNLLSETLDRFPDLVEEMRALSRR